ncbi:MAG: hypothetical protein ACJ8CR_17085 [Roseiflexaceae bacterium]
MFTILDILAGDRTPDIQALELVANEVIRAANTSRSTRPTKPTPSSWKSSTSSKPRSSGRPSSAAPGMRTQLI